MGRLKTKEQILKVAIQKQTIEQKRKEIVSYKNQREKNIRAKQLTLFDIREIRRLIKQGKSKINIAKKYKVTPKTISAIIRGEFWSWLK